MAWNVWCVVSIIATLANAYRSAVRDLCIDDLDSRGGACCGCGASSDGDAYPPIDCNAWAIAHADADADADVDAVADGDCNLYAGRQPKP